MQVGGEGRADVRIVNCFVAVFLSFSLLAFTLPFPGFSARERGKQRREMAERQKGEGLMCPEKAYSDNCIKSNIQKIKIVYCIV